MEKPPSLLSRPETLPSVAPRGTLPYTVTDISKPNESSDNATLVDLRPIIRPPLKRPEPYVPQPGDIIVNDSLPTRRMSEGEHAAVQTRLTPTTSRRAARTWIFGLGLVVLVAAGVALVVTAAYTVAGAPTTPSGQAASAAFEAGVVPKSSGEDTELEVGPIYGEPTTSTQSTAQESAKKPSRVSPKSPASRPPPTEASTPSTQPPTTGPPTSTRQDVESTGETPVPSSPDPGQAPTAE